MIISGVYYIKLSPQFDPHPQRPILKKCNVDNCKAENSYGNFGDRSI
jgi:hypothetical protein